MADALSIEEVAETIRQTGSDRGRLRETMNGLYAETIELTHEPRLPGDGPIPSSVLIALGGQEVAALERAMPDAWLDIPDVSVERDRIRVRNRMGGTLTDGSAVEVSTNTVYTVADGRIVGLRSEMAPEEMQRWAGVLVAGQFEVASEPWAGDP